MDKDNKISLLTVPNAITCFNLLCGCGGIISALEGFTRVAMMCMLAAAVFDFLDGFAARVLKAYSPVGKQLDSLADMVSFGVLPASMLYKAMCGILTDASGAYVLLVFSPFLLTVFSALRLAKFNVDNRQTDAFVGLPTPANALFFASISIICIEHSLGIWTLPALILLFSFLLVCEIPMFSFKVKDCLPEKYSLQLLFLLLSGIIFLLCPLYSISVFAAFAPIVLLYILLNTIKWIWDKINKNNNKQ
ncbi:MAG: CDP-diacylglycerol--serine O-phosphatidyltransferase [Prevotellaceae bacterium]|jgi:CDP-diacylglycerol--serine O-phosphatidyltransferase|nr:CDP-diacylglycerol--serine O-phosphatidyltransferase [Prevotellaceae bacterium]